MGSSRFPKKVLATLKGQPVLWHVVTRMARCPKVDEVVVATSTSPKDDAIVDYCGEIGVTCVRGSEDDVLSRYVMAADTTAADIVVRVTGDAPLADPDLLDHLIATMIAEDADYCIVDPTLKTIHEGFAPVRASALRKLAAEAGDDPVAREHVTAYFNLHPDFVKTAAIPVDVLHRFDGARISVDTPADLAFLEAVYDALGAAPGEAAIPEVVTLLKARPSLLDINRHVHQKAADETSRQVLIRCDGGEALGMGHVIRCLALATELREKQGFGVTFVMGGDPLGMEMVHDAGFRLETCHLPHQVRFMDRLADEIDADVIVVDVRDDLPAAAIERWSDKGILTAILDDLSDRRLAADLAFYPPVPQVQEASWKEARGEVFVGWKWVVLRRQFATNLPRKLAEPPTVLITMGGGDPLGMTFKALDGVRPFGASIKVVLVLGRAFPFRDELKRRIEEQDNITVMESVRNMAALMRSADVAVASFGVTAYELASQGVPAVYLCLTRDHRESAKAFERGGMARCLGLAREVEPPMIHEALKRLFADVNVMDRMSKRAAARVDGQGAVRIAALIQKKCDARPRRLGQ